MPERPTAPEQLAAPGDVLCVKYRVVVLAFILAAACGGGTNMSGSDGGQNGGPGGGGDGPLPTGPQVWFSPAPNSADFFDLFIKPDKWPNSRSKVAVFKFSQGHLHDQGFASYRPVALGTLKAESIDVAMEAEALSVGGLCDPVLSSAYTKEAIQNVQSGGSVLKYIAMDEPLYGGTFPPSSNPPACGFTYDQTVSRTMQYITTVRGADPATQIGDIEPYPSFNPAVIERWIDELESRGASLAFFHLDIYVPAIQSEQQAARDLMELKSFVGARSIPLGVIFWGQDGKTNESFFQQTMALVKGVKQTIGRPQHSIFQSWTSAADGSGVPINLPEADPLVFSHTRLINEGYSALLN